MSTYRHLFFLCAKTLLIFVTIFLIGLFIIEQVFSHQKQLEREYVAEKMYQIRAKLEEHLKQRFSLLQGVVAYVSVHEDVTQLEFEQYAKVLIAEQTGIRSLQLSKNAVISHIYPLEGNEQALGLNLMRRPTERQSLELARQYRKNIIAGPMELVQGGRAIIGRSPIYGQGNQFWGFAHVVIDVDTLFIDSGFKNNTEIELAVRGSDGLGAKGEMIFGNVGLFHMNPTLTEVSLPNGTWVIAAVPEMGWKSYPTIQLKSFAFLISLFITVYAWRLLDHPFRLTQKLSQIEVERDESESRFKTLLEIVPLPILITNIESGKIIFCNKQAEYIFQLNEKELLRRSILDFYVSPTERAEVVQEVTQTGHVNGREVILRSQNNVIFHVNLYAKPVQFVNQTVLAAALIDLSERRKMEAMLRENQAHFDSLLHSAKDFVVFRVKRDPKAPYGGVLIFVSPSVKEIMGVDNIYDYSAWFKNMHPDDAASVATRNHIQYAEKQTFEISLRVFHPKKQEWVYLNSMTNPVCDTSGKVLFFNGVIVDVSLPKKLERSLRESETRFREVADCAPVLIWMSGQDKKCFYFNNVWLEFTGKSLLEEYGSGWTKGVHPDDLESCLNQYTQSFDKRIAFTMEYRLRRHDGEYRWIEDHGKPRYQSDGSFVGYIGSCVDITDRKRETQLAIRESELRWQFALESSGDAMWDWNIQTNQVFRSRRWFNMLGLDENFFPMDYKSWFDRIHPADQEKVASQLAAHLKGDLDQYMCEYRILCGNQLYLWVLDRGKIIEYDSYQKPYRLLGTCSDISLFKKIEDDLKLAHVVFESSLDSVLVTDKDNKIVSANPAFCALNGYDITEILGQTPSILNSGKHNAAYYKKMWASLTESNQWQGEIWNKKKNGEIYIALLRISIVRDSANQVLYHVASFSDISLLKHSQMQLENLANYDQLTHLPNRHYFHQRLDEAILKAKQHHLRVYLLFVDLDNFKAVNDNFGHKEGDNILIQVAQNLQQLVSNIDTVSRLGGDEFTVILESIQSDHEVLLLIQEMIRCNHIEVHDEQNKVSISASIGCVTYPTHATEAEELLKQADEAMYIVKQNGKDNYYMKPLFLLPHEQSAVSYLNKQDNHDPDEQEGTCQNEYE